LPAARRTLAILLGIDLSQYKHRTHHSCQAASSEESCQVSNEA
jgi:hypothetical protein